MTSYKWFRLVIFTLVSSLGYFSQSKKFLSGFKFIRKSCCIHFCRYGVFHSKTGSLDLEKFSPTSTSIAQHIRRANLQTLVPFCIYNLQSLDIKAEDFGYHCNENEQLISQITNNSFNTKIISKTMQLFNMCTKKSLWVLQNVYYVLQMWCWRGLWKYDRLVKLFLTQIFYLCSLLFQKV